MLGAMQSLLTELYDLEVTHDVHDFLITDAELAARLGGGGRDAHERLLILEAGDDAEVALYLHRDLVARLEASDPVARLTPHNLADFWTAFEGVSHFTYFAWRASIDMPMSLLEMELQAEIDKFVATVMLLHRQGERPPSSLHHWLFELPKYDSELESDELDRYERANYYAAKYCRKLWPELSEARQGPGLQRELRRFYRLPRPAKIGHIDAAGQIDAA
jgi:hypothetical protein